MSLSEHQKKYLRGRGHNLKPLIMIGSDGLSKSLLAEFKSTLDHHELLKIKVRIGDRESRNTMIETLCDDFGAQMIQQIGNIALLYRANPQKKPEKRIRIPSH
ncbi:MAG: ribosome assembly RNA-binding protein YhbY [Woeseiaceae bacterium]|jgi:RNA-binding protein|nr:ribosome assembly RNA-binding protein YhbY [Woeseiaceae bacterium]